MKKEKRQSYRAILKCIVGLLALLCSNIHVYAQESNPFEAAVLFASGVTEACPKDPVGFELIGLGETEYQTAYEWFTATDDSEWKPVGTLIVPSNIFQMPEGTLHVRLIAHALDKEGNEVYNREFSYTVNQKAECLIKDCHQTTTGEYHGGTDFNYVYGATSIDWTKQPPTGLEEFFSEQGIHFESKGGTIMSQADLGIPLYIDSVRGVNPNNNFYVQRPSNGQGVNDEFFGIIFDTDKFAGKTYNFTMRLYIIIPEGGCEIKDGFKIQARTGHGTVSTDYLVVDVYDDATNTLLAHAERERGNDVAKYDLNEVVGNDYRINKRGKAAIYRLEMIYYGYMPIQPGLAAYSFYPRMEQFPSCATVAVDYISAEVPSVCMAPRITCVGDVITVNAAGFARQSTYEWKKYYDGTYHIEQPWNEEKGEIEYELDTYGNKQRAYIKMIDKGVSYYTLSTPTDTIRFALGGKICGSALGPGIDGDSSMCITSYPDTQTYKVKNEKVLQWIIENGDDYKYKWWIEAPNGEPVDSSKIQLKMSEDTKSADLIVQKGAKLSGDFNPDQQYTIYVTSHILVSQDSLSLNYESKDSFAVWLYDQPDASRLNFKTESGEDTICVATSSDVIVLEHKEDVMGYDWILEGATMTDSIIHIDGYNKNVLCSTKDTLFPINLEVANGVCKAFLKDTFPIYATDDPTIDCSKLGGPSTYKLDIGRLDTTIHLPVPEYEASCDADPDLNVTIHYEADDSLHSFDSVYVLHRADLENGLTKSTLSFFSGKGTVSFSVVDGCNHHAECSYTLTVIDDSEPEVDCKLVKDYTVEVSTEDGCVAHPGRNLSIEIPVLQDLSFKDTTIWITGVYAGRSEKDLAEDPEVDTTKYSMDKDLYDDYEVGTTFILWKFSDPAGNAMYCHSRVSVLNKERMFSCDTVTTIRTVVNKNPNREYLYASAEAQETVNPDTDYKLKGLLKIPKSNPMYCAQVKLEIRLTGVCVNDKGDSVAMATDSIITPEELLKHRFPVGVSTVYYEFTSDYLDFDSQEYDTVLCSQEVIVSSSPVPVPVDCPTDTTIPVDNSKNCQAPSPYTLNSVPRARVSYFCETKYTYDECSGGSYDYSNLGTSKAYSRDYDTLVYPYMVQRVLYLDSLYQTASTTLVLECENIVTEYDSVPIKKVQHRKGENDEICAEDPIEKMAMMVTNFSTLPSCVGDSFPRGYHMLIWYFENGKGETETCTTHVSVIDTTPPILDTVCKDPEMKVYATECEIPYDKLGLPELYVDDVCDGRLYPELIAYVRQKDSSIIVYRGDEVRKAMYPTEVHKFVWLFTDKAGNQDSCVTYLDVIDSVKLDMSFCDIDKDVVVTLPPGQCSLKADSLKNYMTFPTVVDICDNDTIVPIVQRRFNGKLVTDDQGNPIVWNSQDFPLGKTDIRWIFIDKRGIMKDSCEKSVTVKTELFDCSTLKDTVTVKLLEKFYATAEEVRDSGLVVPRITIDDCHAATLSFKRSDGRDSLDNYEIGAWDVDWTFTYNFGDVKTCRQVVNIVDMVPPVLTCPPLENIDYECYGEIPAPYESFEDLLAHGGSFSEMKKYKEGSFGYSEKESGAAPCNYVLIRTYKVLDVRNHEITCSQEFTIKDVTPPTIHTQLNTITLSCEQDSLIKMYLEMNDVEIEATDNCTADSALTITKQVVTDQSDDPHACGYNSYVITRAWAVSDRCGLISAPLIQHIVVVDTTAPKFKLPDNWLDTVYAANMKHCTQAIPELGEKTNQYVTDLCSDVSDITVWQVPMAGTIIDRTMNVWIYAMDLCGNKDSVMVTTVYQNPKEISSVEVSDVSICSTDTFIDLKSQKIRYANGTQMIEDQHDFYEVSSTFSYDYYKGALDENHLVYSNNTYADRYASLTIAQINELTVLTRRNQSDYYFFVVMDTTTQCYDTAFAYMNIKEEPRINMMSGELTICEGDTLNVGLMNQMAIPCVDSMGTYMVDEGWMLDGVRYDSTAVDYAENGKTVYYYAQNECGTTYSYDSKYTACGWIFPTTLDSLNYLSGSLDALQLWRLGLLKSHDSIWVNVHQKYNPADLYLSVKNDIKRCWVGDEIEFNLESPYTPFFYAWYKTYSKTFDPTYKYARSIESLYEPEGSAELLYLDGHANQYTYFPTDTASYYVVIGDGVCPAVPSNMVTINALNRVPTAFTPTRREGLNDIFLEGREVIIFDRYGNKVMEGSNGWDGTTHTGRFADPGVYYYHAVINGNVYKGTIELIHLDIK